MHLHLCHEQNTYWWRKWRFQGFQVIFLFYHTFMAATDYPQGLNEPLLSFPILPIVKITCRWALLQAKSSKCLPSLHRVFNKHLQLIASLPEVQRMFAKSSINFKLPGNAYRSSSLHQIVKWKRNGLQTWLNSFFLAVASIGNINHLPGHLAILKLTLQARLQPPTPIPKLPQLSHSSIRSFSFMKTTSCSFFPGTN